MTDIETETEKWEGQVSDEWRRDTIWWLRATPNEDLRELVEQLRVRIDNNERGDEYRAGLSTAANELEGLINE